MQLRITKPIEELIGNNRGIVRLKLGHIHCCTRPIDAIREIKSTIRNWNDIPKPLRRGFILCCLQTLNEYKQTYISVMNGGY